MKRLLHIYICDSGLWKFVANRIDYRTTDSNVDVFNTSYLGMEERTSVGGAELRLIPEFGGGADVVEWLEKAALVCELRGISRPETVIPLRLTGGAFAVYQQLPPDDKRTFEKIKHALLTAFAADSFSAYEQFIARRL